MNDSVFVCLPFTNNCHFMFFCLQHTCSVQPDSLVSPFLHRPPGGCTASCEQWLAVCLELQLLGSLGDSSSFSTSYKEPFGELWTPHSWIVYLDWPRLCHLKVLPKLLDVVLHELKDCFTVKQIA